MKTLVLKNYFLTTVSLDEGKTVLPSLPNWLLSIPLHGKESRACIRFVKILSERVEEIEKERIKMIDDYTKKDKDGNPLFIDNEGKETTQRTNRNAFTDEAKLTAEYQAYMNEDYIIDITPSNADIIYTVRDIILNSNDNFSGANAIRYNEICEAFENINEAKEPKAKPKVKK